MGNIDLNKIICVNLKSVNDQQLFSICEKYGYSFRLLHEMKKDGLNIIWVDDELVVAYTYIDWHGQTIFRLQVALTKKEIDRLKKISPIKTPKMPKDDDVLDRYKSLLSKGYKVETKSLDDKIEKKSLANLKIDITIDEVKEELPVILEVDAILEKIGKYGIDSIAKEEKIFLDNLNK